VVLVVLALVALLAQPGSNSNVVAEQRHLPAWISHPQNGALVFEAGTTQTVHGRVQHLPAASPLSDFSWSPDGRELAYEGLGKMRVMQVATGASHALLGCPNCSFAWSPFGRYIAVADLSSIRLVDARTGAVVPIPVPRLSGFYNPSWSPDGTRLAFTAFGSQGRGLFAVDADGSDLRLLFRSGTLAQHNGARNVLFDATWSPDGSVIALLAGHALTAGHAPNLRLSVRTITPTGTQSRHLRTIGSCYCFGFLPGISWSPDGRLLAVDTINAPVDAPRAGLFEMRPDGSHMTWVGTGGNGPLAWQPVQKSGVASSASGSSGSSSGAGDGAKPVRQEL
jgi:WD40 repeat protein